MVDGEASLWNAARFYHGKPMAFESDHQTMLTRVAEGLATLAFAFQVK